MSLTPEGRLAAASHTAPGSSNAIVDNRDCKVGDLLRDSIGPNANLSIVSAYFTIYAYAALRDVLDSVGHIRFLYGDPHGVGEMDPQGSVSKSFQLTEDESLELNEALSQKAIAKACADWIEAKVDIRSVSQAGFLHGKLYHITSRDGMAALVGSSNFTRRGLGYGARPNLELNLDVRSEMDRNALLGWFDAHCGAMRT